MARISTDATITGPEEVFMEIQIDTPVGHIAAEHPAATRVFHRFGNGDLELRLPQDLAALLHVGAFQSDHHRDGDL